MKKHLRIIALLISLSLILVSCGSARIKAGSAEKFTFGYGESEIGFGLADETIYVAGYRGGNSAVGILDIPKVKAVWLEAGQKVLLISADCIALASGTVEWIRASLSDFSRRTGCDEIHVMSTHDHAGGDTLGLWGKDGIDGKNEGYMEALVQAAVSAADAAYSERCEGDIYFGSADCSELLEDTRLPQVFDPMIHCFRFEPDEGGDGVRILNLASHAEALGGDNSLISADFPAYISKSIAERTGDRTIYFPGAIGGLIRTAFTEEDSIENCIDTGRRIADAVLSIDSEVRLEPTLGIVTEPVDIECENTLFIGMRFLGVLENDISALGGRVTVHTSVSLLTFGDRRILLLPGEIFPELVYGNDPDFVPTHPEREDPPTLCELLGDELLIFGLADDEIGYIIPPSDFELHEAYPYLDAPEKDHNGEHHYEETNSVGPGAAAAIADAVKRIAEILK